MCCVWGAVQKNIIVGHRAIFFLSLDVLWIFVCGLQLLNLSDSPLKGDRAMWEHVGCCELARSARSMSLFLAGKIEKDPLHFEFWLALVLSPFTIVEFEFLHRNSYSNFKSTSCAHTL